MPADAPIALKEKFAKAVERPSIDHPAFNVPVGEIPAVLKYLRDEAPCDLVMDVSAIDNGEATSPRFTMVYRLVWTARPGSYLRIAADCADDAAPTAPSVVTLWAAANWHERACFDVFGIEFTEHPDLRRILMWDGYPYHPL